MSVRIHLAGPLTPYASGRRDVELAGRFRTVADALAALWALHPAVRDRVLTEQGHIRPHVNVFVGAEAVQFAGGLAALVPDGCEISILPAVSGG